MQYNTKLEERTLLLRIRASLTYTPKKKNYFSSTNALCYFNWGYKFSHGVQSENVSDINPDFYF